MGTAGMKAKFVSAKVAAERAKKLRELLLAVSRISDQYDQPGVEGAVERMIKNAVNGVPRADTDSPFERELLPKIWHMLWVK